MSDKIKTRESTKDIKLIDKSANIADKMKNAYIRTKDEAQHTPQSEHSSPSDYATDNATHGAENTVYETGHQIKKQTGKVVDKIKDTRKAEKQADNAFEPVKEQAKKYTQQNMHNTSRAAKQASVKSIKTVQKANKSIKQSAKGTIKTAQKSVKIAKQTAKATIKTTQQTAKTSVKTAQATVKASKATAQAARATAKAVVTTTKVAVKATITAVKATIAAIKGLVALIAAGGWIAIVVILLICMVALIFGSCFGIFFSNEDTGNQNGTIMSNVISQINSEFSAEIERIKSENPHDEVDGLTTPQNWKEVLAVYAVKCTTDPDNSTDIATIDESKIETLRKIFWDMITISFSIENVETETNTSDTPIFTTSEPAQQESKTILHVLVSYKGCYEIAAQYRFNLEQNNQLNELLNPEYDDMWSALLSG